MRRAVRWCIGAVMSPLTLFVAAINWATDAEGDGYWAHVRDVHETFTTLGSFQ